MSSLLCLRIEICLVICNITKLTEFSTHKNSSVGIALGYRLDDWGSGIRFPVGAGNFSLHHRVQKGSGAHPASFPGCIRGSFPGVKWPGREADHSLPSSAEVKNA
jgi:hypothetical protein